MLSFTVQTFEVKNFQARKEFCLQHNLEKISNILYQFKLILIPSLSLLKEKFIKKNIFYHFYNVLTSPVE